MTYDKNFRYKNYLRDTSFLTVKFKHLIGLHGLYCSVSGNIYKRIYFLPVVSVDYFPTFPFYGSFNLDFRVVKK